MACPRVVILSAGASRRLGQPKALVQLPGGAPLFRLVRAATQAAGIPPIVVTGAHHAEITKALGQAQFEQVPLVYHNQKWAKGRTGSVICAAQDQPDTDLCILPVDHPRIQADLLARLFAEWERRHAPPRGWLAPACGTPQAPGHPIVIGRELVASLLTKQDTWQDRPLSQLRSQAAPLWMLSTDDAAIHENLDTPEDLEAIRRLDTPS